MNRAKIRGLALQLGVVAFCVNPFTPNWAQNSPAPPISSAPTAAKSVANIQPSDTALPSGIERVQTVEGITEYRLGNGMKVLLAPDLADERVTVNLTYMVGSRHEGAGEGGMAHLLEHLIFKGTPTNPDPKLEFRKRGFTFNGTTAADRTNYFATFVSNQESLNWYLGWQADAMVNSFIAQKDLDSEMTVVRNEFEIKGNNAVVTLIERMNHATYQWHGYGRATIGNRADLEHINIAQLQSFYKRFYRPDNAVLIVAGKFDIGQTLIGIAKTLGAVAKPDVAIAQTHTQEPVRDGESSVTVRRPATQQVLISSYRIPPALHPDSAALSVLAVALGDSPSGRLHKALVESKLTMGVFAMSAAQREAGIVLFGTVFAPGDDPAPRQKLLLDMVESVSKEPIREDEFERAKLKINKNLELGFANAAAVATGAINMEVVGDWRAVFVNRERLKAVTLVDVNRVASSYLLQDNRVLGSLIPTNTPVRAPEMGMPDVAAYLQGFALSEKGEESFPFDYSTASLHDKVVFSRTPGDLKTAVLQKPVRGELVDLAIQFKFGSGDSLKNQSVAAVMAARMLDKGTTKMTRQQIHDAQIKLGAALRLNFSNSGGTLTLKVKKENFKAALDLAMHLLKESRFVQAEFDEIVNAEIKVMEGQIKDQSAQANNAWSRYGNPYPEGDVRYRHTLEEWLQKVKSVSLEQAFAFYQQFYGAQDAQVSVLGPVDIPQYQALVAEALDGWKAPKTYQRIEHPLVERTPARLVYDTPDKTNVELRANRSIPLRAGIFDPEDYSLALATRIFGGGPGSRLWVRLRETDGLSYSASASYSASRYDANATLSLNAQVAPQNTSAAEAAIKEELARSLKDGFFVDEVVNFRRQYMADRLRERSGDAWALGFMWNQMEFDIPRDGYERGDAIINGLSTEQVNAAWRKFVQPEKLVWGVFGDQSKMK